MPASAAIVSVDADRRIDEKLGLKRRPGYMRFALTLDLILN